MHFGDATFAWQEQGGQLRNGCDWPDADREVESLGTQTSATTWQLTVTHTLAKEEL
jgi:hypothetical protein